MSAVQWYEGFEAEFGNVEGIRVQPLLFQGHQAQPLASQGYLAQPFEHQSSQPQPQGAQPRGVSVQPFAAVQQPSSIDAQHSQIIGCQMQPWGFYTQPSGKPQIQPQGCQTQPLDVQPQTYAVCSNIAQHATVSTMIQESILQPETPDQQEAELTKSMFGIANTSDPTEQQLLCQGTAHLDC